jgi:uncharacterized protein (TIGR02145 family)
LTTASTTIISSNSATSGGNITSDGGATVTDRGVCWSTNQTPTTIDSHTSDGTGTGIFVSNIIGLNASTTYYVRAYATNSVGTAYGNQVSFTSLAWTCGSTITINHVTGSVAPLDKTVTYGTVTNIPGEPSKCWITQNLGADHQATAVNDATEVSAGWYWQFNRKQGYKNDGTTITPSWTINSISENSNWIASNDPCTLELGSGWRIPTSAEWTNVDASGYWSDWNGPWNSNLKLHAAGYLTGNGGMLDYRGSIGFNWSNSQSTDGAGFILYFNTGFSNISEWEKVSALSLRCLNGSSGTTIPTLTTSSVTNTASNTATSGGNITSDGGATVTARGVCWSTSQTPTTADSHTTDGTGTGAFVSSITGLNAATTYYVRAYAINNAGTAYGNQQSFTTLAWACGSSSIIDIDGNNYNTVLIGTQCWMGENLKTTTYSNGNPITYIGASAAGGWQYDIYGAYTWYNGDITWKDIYGALYNFRAVSKSDGLCPTGWHVPTDAEWTALANGLGGSAIAGGKLKSTSTEPANHPRWDLPNTGASNSSGFTGYPGGDRHSGEFYENIGINGRFWTSTAINQEESWLRWLSLNDEALTRTNVLINSGLSVRCLKN